MFSNDNMKALKNLISSAFLLQVWNTIGDTLCKSKHISHQFAEKYLGLHTTHENIDRE